MGSRNEEMQGAKWGACLQIFCSNILIEQRGFEQRCPFFPCPFCLLMQLAAAALVLAFRVCRQAGNLQSIKTICESKAARRRLEDQRAGTQQLSLSPPTHPRNPPTLKYLQ